MSLEARHALLEWALQAAREELQGTDWVDADAISDRGVFTVSREGGEARFRHVSLGDRLPAPMQEAAAAAEERGEPTALEFLTRMLARAQWLTSTRRYLWTPFSPVPQLLASLVEAYGIDAELHDRDGGKLANLLVHLPAWHPHRGNARAAIELLRIAMDTELPVTLGSDTGCAFTCQSAEWWAEREPPGTLILEGDLVTGKAVDDPEDVVLAWDPTEPFPHELLRLLPASTSVRLAPENP